jgi:hypothetical protein
MDHSFLVSLSTLSPSQMCFDGTTKSDLARTPKFPVRRFSQIYIKILSTCDLNGGFTDYGAGTTGGLRRQDYGDRLNNP